MARLNMKKLYELHDAINKIKEFKSQIGIDNKPLAEFLENGEKMFHDRLNISVKDIFIKSK